MKNIVILICALFLCGCIEQSSFKSGYENCEARYSIWTDASVRGGNVYFKTDHNLKKEEIKELKRIRRKEAKEAIESFKYQCI